MCRYTLILLSLVVAAPITIAEEPSFNGRTVTEWMTMVKEDALPRKRKAAIIALGQIASDSKDAHKAVLVVIVKAMKTDANAGVRGQAAVILGQQPTESAALFVPDFAEALRSERDTDTRREIATSIGRFGKLSQSSVTPLIDVLKDATPRTRAAAAEALGRIGKDAQLSAVEVTALTKDADRNVRYAAVFALGRIEPENTETTATAILAMLQTERGNEAKVLAHASVGSAAMWAIRRDSEIVAASIVSLGLLAEKNAVVTRAVANYLRDPDPEIRQNAVLTLGKFGSVTKSVEANLTSTFANDSDKQVRQYALQTLCSIYSSDGKTILPSLLTRLKADPDYEVRVAIAEEIGGFGMAFKDNKDAVNALREAQRDSQVKVREAASLAIRQLSKSAEKPKP